MSFSSLPKLNEGIGQENGGSSERASNQLTNQQNGTPLVLIRVSICPSERVPSQYRTNYRNRNKTIRARAEEEEFELRACKNEEHLSTIICELMQWQCADA